VLFGLFSWLGKRSLFVVTDDWSPAQSITLALIFSRRREKRGVTPSLLLCSGHGALPAPLAMASPPRWDRDCIAEEGTEKLQHSPPARAGTGELRGLSGREHGPGVLGAAVAAPGVVAARRYPGRCRGLCLSCRPQTEPSHRWASFWHC